MIRRIIRFSAENRFLVLAASLVLLAFSWWSMRQIPLDALPDLSDTQVIVYSKWDRSPTWWRTRSPTPSSPPSSARRR